MKQARKKKKVQFGGSAIKLVRISERLYLAYRNLHTVIYEFDKNGSMQADLIVEALGRIAWAKGLVKK